MIKVVDPTAAILPHRNSLLPPITTGRELPILHTRLREYIKFTSPAYHFKTAGGKKLYGAFYLNSNVDPKEIAEAMAVDCVKIKTHATVKENQELVTMTSFILLYVSNRLCPEQMAVDVRSNLLRIQQTQQCETRSTEIPELPNIAIRLKYPREIRVYETNTTEWKTDANGKRDWGGVNNEGKKKFTSKYLRLTCLSSVHCLVRGKFTEK